MTRWIFLKRFSSRELRQAVVGRGSLYTLLSDQIERRDPYAPGALAFLRSVYEKESYRGWLAGKKLFSGVCDDICALENLWATLQHLRDIQDFLLKGVTLEGNASVINRAKQLVLSRPIDPESRLYRALFEDDDDLVPDLFPFTGFSNQVRLRWGLAARVQRTSPYINLFRCAGSLATANANDAFELLRVAIERYPQSKPNNSRKLTQAEIIATNDVEFEFLSKNDSFANLSCAKPIRDFSEWLSYANQFRAKYKSDFETLSTVLERLSNRQWREASSVVESLRIDRITKIAVSNLREAINAAKERANSEAGDSWSYMSSLGYGKISQLFGRKFAKSWYTLSDDKIARHLISGKLSAQSLSISDIKQLNATWETNAKQDLLDAGQYAAFVERFDEIWKTQSVTTLIASSATKGKEQESFLAHYLPDQISGEELIACLISLGSIKTSFAVQRAIAARVRSKTNQWGQCSIESWDEILASEISTQNWSIALKKRLVKKPKFQQFIYAVNKSSKNCELREFQEEAVAIIKKIKKANPDDVKGLMVWFDRRPSDACFLAPHLSTAVMASILKLSKCDCSLNAIRALYGSCETSLKPEFWRMQLAHVAEATDLIELGTEGIKNHYTSEWNPGWRGVAGSKVDRARALVLMARNDIVRLKRLRDAFTDDELSEAILWLSRLDSLNSTYEKIFFELTSVLGLRHSATLKWLLHQRDFKEPLGYRFEDLYSTYEIPKKSGKPRLICAPNSALKRIQKALVINLLHPLGAHKSVYGFVPGRSIVDNARHHVSKDVVVSVDIRDCFPSVRWPLILSALRRDLGGKLRQETLLFLLDLFTKDGRLPIGAPTSPSVLNRVLTKTDEILYGQAYSRGYDYTRYADDITFSGDKNVTQMIGITRGVLTRINLELDPKKTNIFRRGRRQLCTGLVVNENVNIPRKVRKRLRAAVHAFQAGKNVTWNGEMTTLSSLRGRLEFLKMVSPLNASDMLAKYEVANAERDKKNASRNRSPNTGKNSR